MLPYQNQHDMHDSRCPTDDMSPIPGLWLCRARQTASAAQRQFGAADRLANTKAAEASLAAARARNADKTVLRQSARSDAGRDVLPSGSLASMQASALQVEWCPIAGFGASGFQDRGEALLSRPSISLRHKTRENLSRYSGGSKSLEYAVQACLEKPPSVAGQLQLQIHQTTVTW